MLIRSQPCACPAANWTVAVSWKRIWENGRIWVSGFASHFLLQHPSHRDRSTIYLLSLVILFLKMMYVLFLILSVYLVSTLAGNCGGNCPGNDCSSCPCGTTANHVDIASWCAKHSWNQAHCQCIISHESGGNANAVNYNAGQSSAYLWDVGLW